MTPVFWSPEAIEALKAIVLRSNELSAGSGDRLALRIHRRIEYLSEYPMSGRVVPEFDTRALREAIVSPYRLFYRVATDRVEIVTIFHGSMSLDPREPG